MLQIVKGDLFEICVCPCDIPPALIQRLVFSSKDLAVEQDAFIEEEMFRVRLLGERTKDFPKGIAHYDITALLIDGQQMTLKRNGLIEVVDKVNEVRDG